MKDITVMYSDVVVYQVFVCFLINCNSNTKQI